MTMSQRRAWPALWAFALILPMAVAQSPDRVVDAPTLVMDPIESMVTLLDFDGDGDKDVVTQALTNNRYVSFRLYRNDQGELRHDGAMGAGTGTNMPANPDAMGGFLGPRDAYEDLLMMYGEYVAAVLFTPFGRLQVGPLRLAGPVLDIAILDANGDGAQDFVAVTANTVVLFESVGISGFMPRSRSAGPFDASVRLAACDLGRDGRDELAILNPTTSTLTIHSFQAQGMTTLATHNLGWTPSDLTAGDVDGQEGDDLVLFGMVAGVGHYEAFKQTAAGTMSTGSVVAGGPATALADVDGDGDLDGVCCGGGGGIPDQVASQKVWFEIAINDGTGSFAPSYRIANVGAYHIAGVSDMDGDGWLDLVAGRCIHFAEKSFGEAPYGNGLGAQPELSTLGDLDGDGDIDYLTPDGTIGWNRGDWNFQAQAMDLRSAPPTGTASSVVVGAVDLDEDGTLELLLEHRDAMGQTIGVHALVSRAGAWFDRGPMVPAGMSLVALRAAGPRGLLVRDLNLDGAPDLLLRQAQPAGSTILINDGTGFYATSESHPGEWIEEILDFTGDGIPDLLTAGPSFDVYPGLPGGGYLTPAVLLAGDQNTFLPLEDHLEIKDLDGDGLRDLVLLYGTGTVSSRLTVVHNLGGWNSPPFEIREPPAGFGFPFRPGARRVFVEDLNGDGRDDLIVQHSVLLLAGGTTVFLATGAPLTYWSPSVSSVYATDTILAIEDIDLDGAKDLVTTGGILRNRRFSPDAAGARLQYGSGLLGSANIVPLLGAPDPIRPGVMGRIRIEGGLGGAQGLLALGGQELASPLVGGTLLVNPAAYLPITLGGPLGAPGEGSLDLNLGVLPASLAGVTVYWQAGLVDPNAPLGISLTNGLKSIHGQ